MADHREQKEHLLESVLPRSSSSSSSSSVNIHEFTPDGRGRSLRRRILSSPWLYHLTLLSFYTTIFLLLLHSNASPSCTTHPEIISSPARAAIEWQRKIYEDVPDTTDFSGPARPELDAAWHNLMAPTIIRVSAEELEAANTTSIPLTGGGHPAALSVYHELHCVKKLRHSLSPEYYYADETPEEYKKRWMHLDHCLEVLRHNAMCHGDFAIYGFSWDGKPRTDDIKGVYGKEVKPATLPAWHECINWDRFVEWAEKRRIHDVKSEWDRANWE
ncbi:hypothetical protein EDC01DRAFT_618721 [Geopyxis carbonaria]|nr:hypothetical protein EDC01DRAFT_618721 [Geopyxis carbonaria]